MVVRKSTQKMGYNLDLRGFSQYSSYSYIESQFSRGRFVELSSSHCSVDRAN